MGIQVKKMYKKRDMTFPRLHIVKAVDFEKAMQEYPLPLPDKLTGEKWARAAYFSIRARMPRNLPANRLQIVEGWPEIDVEKTVFNWWAYGKNKYGAIVPEIVLQRGKLLPLLAFLADRERYNEWAAEYCGKDGILSQQKKAQKNGKAD